MLDLVRNDAASGIVAAQAHNPQLGCTAETDTCCFVSAEVPMHLRKLAGTEVAETSEIQDLVPGILTRVPCTGKTLQLCQASTPAKLSML